MSRIAEALSVWERTKPLAAPPPETAASAASPVLNRYPQEQQPATDDETPTMAVVVPHQAATAATSGKPLPDKTTTAHTSRRIADLQARLVTTASNTTSLEQFRRLAAVLHDVQADKQLKTVMITSAVPQEGKTLTLVNLALTLSESYARRVLVIDADLRWPSLHSVLDVPNMRGLSEALREGRHELPIVEVSEHLSVLTAGHPGSRPLAGLSSPRMAEVIDECAARFDWVLIDTSPVGVIPDASVLGRLVGGVIFVIRAGSTPAAAVERAIAEIGPESIIGTVLNRVDERRIPAAGYYSHYGRSPHRR